ncbi:MAG: TusE/DsrC/DsvC family sulfur relay protein [Rickettsiella sp.]|nr:TusE/DsrC/DsvC family sulfur relay protein [Rickettsiella sp.]
MGALINGEENEKILTDKDGYLIHLSDWHEKVATDMAKKEALILSKDHWHVIYSLRNYYQQYHKIPSIRMLANQLAVQIGAAKADSVYLHSLFPAGVLKQASKLAGLPRPARCM